VNFYTVVYTGA